MGRWGESTVEDIKAPSENALATGPFGSSIGSRYFRDTGIPVIRGGNLSEDIGTRLKDEGLVFLTPDKAQEFTRSMVRKGDLVFTCWGTVNQVGLIDERAAYREYVISNKQMKLSPDPAKADSLFLYYLFSSPEVQDRIKSESIGSSVPGFNLGQLRKMRLPIPELEEQRAIAHILGTLDDRIELNRRMNETLEAVARALFKSWFVDFDPVRAKAEGRDTGLPEPLAKLFPDTFEDWEQGEIPTGWEVGPLGRFFELGLGGAWGEDVASDRASVSVRCLRGIDCHELAEGRIPDVPVRWVSPKQTAGRQLSEGTVLIEGSGSFCGRSMIWKKAYGRLLGEPVGYSNFCKRLDPLCSASQAVICWMQMRQAYRDGLLQSFRTGTAFPNFDVHGALGSLIVVVPPVRLAEEYGRSFEFGQRLDLMAQSRTLAALRDTLLPKLVSGEVRPGSYRFGTEAKPRVHELDPSGDTDGHASR